MGHRSINSRKTKIKQKTNMEVLEECIWLSVLELTGYASLGSGGGAAGALLASAYLSDPPETIHAYKLIPFIAVMSIAWIAINSIKKFIEKKI